MNDPTRVLAGDSASPLDERERALLRAAIDEQPSAEAFGQLTQALGLTASVVPAPPVHLPAPAATLRAPTPSSVLFPKWLVGLAVDSVLTGALLSRVLQSPPPSAPRPVANSQSAEPQPDAPRARDLAVPTTTPAVAVPHPRGAASSVRDTSPQAAPLALADELRRLDLVRAALRASAPAEALVQLQAYQQHHVAGTLSEEAEALQIETALALGRHVEATQRSRTFLRVHPDSVHRARVHALLSQAADGD